MGFFGRLFGGSERAPDTSPKPVTAEKLGDNATENAFFGETTTEYDAQIAAAQAEQRAAAEQEALERARIAADDAAEDGTVAFGDDEDTVEEERVEKAA